MKTLFSFFALSICFFMANAQLTFTNADNNGTLNLEPAAKQTILIELTQNGGTPFQWKLVKNNELVCILEKEDSKPVEPAISGMVGTPEIRQFYFKTTGKAGLSQIKMQLVSFSGEVAQEFNFSVKSPYTGKKTKRK